MKTAKVIIYPELAKRITKKLSQAQQEACLLLPPQPIATTRFRCCFLSASDKPLFLVPHILCNQFFLTTWIYALAVKPLGNIVKRDDFPRLLRP